MKSCGVITEYNPFHNGHEYHLKMAREKSQADVIVAVMSGNFLQRGEPAIIDKWQRAELALTHGADLVIELPFADAVQSADYFGAGSVKLLHALGVKQLCFGTDSATEVDYQGFAEFNHDHHELIEECFQKIRNNGMSYPQQMTAVYRELLPSWQLDFNSPNHILAMSYAKANQEYQQPMELLAIKRQVSAHHQETIDSQQFASGTAIRKAMLTGEMDPVRQVVPNEMFARLEESTLGSWEKAWPLLKYQLMTSTVAQLAEVYQMVEGIEYRLKEMVAKADSFVEFVSLVKTKRFTWTRIQRLCTYVLLNVHQNDLDQSQKKSYLRVLGFNPIGRQFLSQGRKNIELPVIPNVNKGNEELLSLDIKAGKVYQLLTNSPEQDYYRGPINLK